MLRNIEHDSNLREQHMTTHISTNVRYTRIAVIATLLCCIGCSNNSTGPAKSGNSLIKGTVQLQSDEYDNPIADQSGTEVVLDNGVDVFKTTTLRDGSWQVANVPASVYTITASRPEFSGLYRGDGNDTAKNVQYVGAGTFTAPSLRLAKAISPAMISDPQVAVKVTYLKDSIDPKHSVRRDTLVEVVVKCSARNNGKYQFFWGISDKSDPTCDDFIIKGNDYKAPESGVLSIGLLNYSYNELRSKLGSNFRDRTFFVHIRPRFDVRTSNVSVTQPVCLPSVIASFTL